MYFKIEMLYFNQNLHNLSNQFLKMFILIRFKEIEANYLYVYQTNFIFKISHMNCFLHVIMI
jgi:hypothetical protein